jgi:hypothetical protein
MAGPGQRRVEAKAAKSWRAGPEPWEFNAQPEFSDRLDPKARAKAHGLQPVGLDEEFSFRPASRLL